MGGRKLERTARNKKLKPKVNLETQSRNQELETSNPL